ncbi:MAG: PAS domain S-box protein, partial [Myxococcota bacterium]
FPLQHRREPMGVLFMRAAAERGPLSERTIRAARTIAHTTAVALRNAQMFERIRQQSAQATAEKAEAEKEVADLKQMQAELHKTKGFLENLVDSSPDAIIATNMQGRILVWNKAAERIIGYSREEATANLHVADVYHDDAREVMAALRADTGGGPGRLEQHPVHILSKDGERIPVTLSASMLYEEGREMASVGILKDMRGSSPDRGEAVTGPGQAHALGEAGDDSRAGGHDCP